MLHCRQQGQAQVLDGRCPLGAATPGVVQDDRLRMGWPCSPTASRLEVGLALWHDLIRHYGAILQNVRSRDGHPRVGCPRRWYLPTSAPGRRHLPVHRGLTPFRSVPDRDHPSANSAASYTRAGLANRKAPARAYSMDVVGIGRPSPMGERELVYRLIALPLHASAVRCNLRLPIGALRPRAPSAGATTSACHQQ
jgi:hypothetical protein